MLSATSFCTDILANQYMGSSTPFSLDSHERNTEYGEQKTVSDGWRPEVANRNRFVILGW